MAIVWYHNGTGGRGGRGPSLEKARLTPQYLTLSADFHRQIGAPENVIVGYDEDALAVYVKAASPDTLVHSMSVCRHGGEGQNRRKRIAITEPLKRMRIHDRVPRHGMSVREAIQRDGSVAFYIDRKALKPAA